MAFTPEQDAFILKAHYRSGTLTMNRTWVYSSQFCRKQFNEAFPDVIVSNKVFFNHKDRLIQRFEGKHCICKNKSSGRSTVLTQEVLADIRNRVDRSPNKSLRKLSVETELSYKTCRKALKNVLHMHPYKVNVVQELREIDYERRINYCQWFNNTLRNDNDLLDLTFFTDESWFHLSGYVNSQNYRTWATDNPHQFIETNLHPIKIGIWVAISRRRIIGPILFNETITADSYQRIILTPFINQLHDDELERGYFQQDNAPAHTARTTLQYLEQYYGNRLISQDLWPARSPDLTPLDFYLFGNLKNKIFQKRLQNLNELIEAIEIEIRNITPEELQNVFENVKRRVQICLQNNGHHFQQFL